MKTSNLTSIIVIALAFFIADKASAQDSHIAVLLNMVNSNFNYGEKNRLLSDYKKDVRGLQAGLSWQAGLAENFSIVTEGYFIRKGGRLQSGNPLMNIGSTVKLYTVEVPVLARLHAGRWYFNVGPYSNYMISGKILTPESSEKISFGNGKFKRWEAGMQAGVGFQFKIKRTKMAIDVRYSHGMTSLSKDSKLFNRTLNISVLAFKSLKGKTHN
mgnify:CR=1 FL=1